MTESTRAGIDWQRVHETLALSRRLLDEGAQPTTEASREILERRARALAEPLVEDAAPTDARELLVFSRGESRYAVETTEVVEVIPLLDPTPVPCTPPAIVGIANHRGRILPLLDLGLLLAAAELRAAETPVAVVVQAVAGRLGIGADAVAGIERIDERDVLPADGGARRGGGVVRGVTRTMVSVLDVEALVRDPRVQVNEYVE